MTRGTIARIALPLVALVSVASLAACSAATAPPPAPTQKPRLVVEQVAYDCSTRTLIVLGTATPARQGQRVQVQVRSAERPLAPVWRIASAEPTGQFRATGSYAIDPGETVELRVKLASVVGGNRVFSQTALRSVTCPKRR